MAQTNEQPPESDQPAPARALDTKRTDYSADQSAELRRDSHRLPGFMGHISEALAREDQPRVLDLLKDVHAADVADILETLAARERARLIDVLAKNFDPEILAEIGGEAQDQLLEALPNEQIARAVEDLDSDDAIYVLEELDDDDRGEVLDALPEVERKAFERALSYPEDSAGRLMQTDLLALPEYWTVGQTIDYLRVENPDLPDDFYEVIVVDPSYKPIGTIPASRVLRIKREASLRDIMQPDPHIVDVTADQEDVAYRFSKYHLISASVVDASGRLVGAITVDDIVGVIEEEAQEDILALAGVGESLISDRIGEAVKSRFSWLFVNLGTAVLASAVIGLFDATIEQMVALAVLMPIIASMGGNAATQTMTVAVRALATKELSPVTAGRALRREMLIGIVNGLMLALISGGLAILWFDDLLLGGVFAVAMIANLFIAALCGLLVPLALTRLDVDPAVASSVFVTTITDVVGFFAFLGLAALVLF